MTQQFENFVNAALDKSLASDVTLPTANKIPVFTGIGRQVTGKTIVELGLATSSQLTGKADLVDGLVPANQLPSYVDDVLEYANLASFPLLGEASKLYIAIDTNLVYRWSGSTYAVTSSSLALGETSTTAYRGDRGKTAYDHSQATGNPHNLPAASTNVDGYLTSTDWNTFNNKQAALADVITANTYGSATQYPKVTVNAKGIVTGVTLQTVEAPATFSDSAFRIQDNGDANKLLAFELSGIVVSPAATPTVKTITIPNANVDLGNLSSIATTDSNTLSGTRNRIVGGSGNSVGGTDNIVIAAKNSTTDGTGNKVYGSSLVTVSSSLSNCTFNNVLNEYGAPYGNSYSLPLFANAYKTNTLDGVTFSGWLNTVVTSVKWPKGYEVRGYKTTTLQNILAAVHTKAYVILNTVAGQPNADVVISDDTSRKPVGLCDEIFVPLTFSVSNKNSCHRLRINGYISGCGSFRLERDIFVTNAVGDVQISTPVADYVDAVGVTLTVTASVAASTAGGFYRDLTINVSHNHSLASYILGTGTLESSMFNVLTFA